MVRVIVLLASTLLFSVLGLVVGHLYVSAAQEPSGRVNDDTLLLGYFLVPLIGAAFGSVLSFAAIKLLGARPEDAQQRISN